MLQLIIAWFKGPQPEVVMPLRRLYEAGAGSREARVEVRDWMGR